jgi:hypothetical protein
MKKPGLSTLAVRTFCFGPWRPFPCGSRWSLPPLRSVPEQSPPAEPIHGHGSGTGLQPNATDQSGRGTVTVAEQRRHSEFDRHGLAGESGGQAWTRTTGSWQLFRRFVPFLSCIVVPQCMPGTDRSSYPHPPDGKQTLLAIFRRNPM